MQKKPEADKEPLEVRLKRADKELKERARARRVQNAKRLKEPEVIVLVLLKRITSGINKARPLWLCFSFLKFHLSKIFSGSTFYWR